MPALTIRIDPALEGLLDQAVQQTGLTKSEFIRQAIAEKIARMVDPIEHAQLWAQAANRQALKHDEFYTEI